MAGKSRRGYYMLIKAIVVDLDYTLVDASRGIHLCITHALKMMGYPETVSTLKM